MFKLNCECTCDKRNYTKSTNEYWSDIIFKQRAAKKAKISEEMSLVSDKYSENDPVHCSIDDLSVTEIRDELKKIGVKTRLKNRDKLLDLLKSKRQLFRSYFLRPHVRKSKVTTNYSSSYIAIFCTNETNTQILCCRR